jgi:hypothetical protein
MQSFSPRTLALAAALVGLTGSAGAGEEDEAEAGIAVEDALAVPTDPDDEADIRADDDPDDVGQEGLDAPDADPGAAMPPSAGEPRAQEP